MKFRFMRPWSGHLVVVLLALTLATSGMVVAQSTSSSIRGTVTEKSGPLPGATVVGVNTTTGFQYPTTSNPDGSFALNGLAPGTYKVTVNAPGYTNLSRTIDIGVGTNVNLQFRLTAEELVVENVAVVGQRIQETKTSEVATEVTKEVLNALPQNDRNFLNFVNLAPGVKTSLDPNNKQVRALGQPAFSSNVFIDGVSYKNDVLEGGVVGQDASRGNPFPQDAVQEYKILTQNFKAEYEKASTSIISAVTRSGGNTWAGDVFTYYQDKSFVEKDYFARKNNSPKADYTRYQSGFSVGGPLIKDKLTLFGTFEINYQNRNNTVTLGGNRPEGFDPTPFLGYQGTFSAPFRSKLGFGKLNWQPALNQTVEFTGNWRSESDKRNFGGSTSIETGEYVKVDTKTAAVKHKLINSHYLNEASLQYQQMEWNPTSVSTDPQRNYFGFVTIGGRNGSQDFKQDRLALRDDFTYLLKNHTVKAGVVLSFNTYDAKKLFGGDGQFNYDNNPGLGRDFNAPFEAYFSTGDPRLKADNKQYGLYVQDDWVVTPKLLVNLGVRWDYESDMLNNSFVTPQEFRDALVDFDTEDKGGRPDDGTYWGALSDAGKAGYISSGSSRKAPKNTFQPRLGFSYDLHGDGKSVIFGGAGRYYDRVLYNYGFDEKFRLNWRTYHFCFYSNPTEQANCGEQGIAWNDSYLQKGALQNLLESSSGPLGKPEIFLLPNDIKVPYNDQFSLGYRHNFGSVIAEIAATKINGKNGFSFQWGNRVLATGNNRDVNSSFSNLLLGSFDKEYEYKGVYVKFERPFTANAKYGYTITYTLSKSQQKGNDAFSLDYSTVSAYPWFPGPDDERHRIVATGIIRGPWDTLFSGNLTLSSGLPYTVLECGGPLGCWNGGVKLNVGTPDQTAFIYGNYWGYKNIDLRAEKQFPLGGDQSLSVILEVFNVFNWNNFSGYDGWNLNNPNFGNPGSIVGTPRAFQAGLKYHF